jgi:site-specific DNA-cytosine methylase
LHHRAGQALIPEDADNVTTGFACDGFSTLNNFPIALEDKGEPGDTFDGIKAYLETYHPKIVIFENTMNALWMAEKVAN